MTINAPKQTGNMYSEYWTWNPLAGACQHDCHYCSTKALMRYPVIREKYTGPPRLVESYLNDDLGSGRDIFVVAQGDLMASNVPAEFIERILKHCCDYPHNTYLLQTKNPERFAEFEGRYPPGVIFCITLESDMWYPQMGKAPAPVNRIKALEQFIIEREVKTTIQITIEPIMKFNIGRMINMIARIDPNIVAIGADSKHHHLHEPSGLEVIKLIKELNNITTVKIKSNLKRITG